MPACTICLRGLVVQTYKQDDKITRQRQCSACSRRFTTIEVEVKEPFPNTARTYSYTGFVATKRGRYKQ